MAELSEATSEKVAIALADSDLVRFGKFTLKSGVESPVYIDLRKIQSHPMAFHVIIAAYSEMIADLDEDTLIAGVPEAATPLASALGYELKRPIVQPRKVVKEHGTKNAVEGEFGEGDKVVLVDDLITKGHSKIEAIQQVEAAGLKVERLIVLVDREQGGIESISEAGYNVEAAITMTNLMATLLKLNKIDQVRHAEVMDFIRSN